MKKNRNLNSLEDLKKEKKKIKAELTQLESELQENIYNLTHPISSYRNSMRYCNSERTDGIVSNVVHKVTKVAGTALTVFNFIRSLRR